MAVVLILEASEPASASVKAKAAKDSPLAIGPSHFFLCSSEPNRMIGMAASALAE